MRGCRLSHIKKQPGAKVIFAIFAFALLVLASCDSTPGIPETQDWCALYDFTESDHEFNLVAGTWEEGTGFITADGLLSFSYDYDEWVTPSVVFVTITRPGDVTGAIGVTAAGTIYGVTAELSAELPDLLTTETISFLPATTGDAGKSINVTLDAGTDKNLIIERIDVWGNGASPFPDNPCNKITPTITPSPTATVITATVPATNTPITYTPTDTETVTPTETPDPGTWTETYDLTNSYIQDCKFRKINHAHGAGIWTTSGLKALRTDPNKPARRLYAWLIFPDFISLTGVEVTANFGVSCPSDWLSEGWCINRVTSGDNLSSPYYGSAVYFDYQPGAGIHTEGLFDQSSVTTDRIGFYMSIPGDIYVTSITIQGEGQNPFVFEDFCTTPEPTATPTDTPTPTPTATRTQLPGNTPTEAYRTPIGGQSPTPTQALSTEQLTQTQEALTQTQAAQTETQAVLTETQAAQTEAAAQTQTAAAYTSTPYPTLTYIPSATAYTTEIAEGTPTPSTEEIRENEAEWEILESMEGFQNWIENVIGGSINWLGEIFNAILNWFGGIFDWVFGAINNLIELLGAILAAILALIGAAFALIVEIVEIFLLLIQLIVGLIGLLLLYLEQLIARITALITAFYYAPATPIPGLPQCHSDPIASDICAIYYILDWTIFAPNTPGQYIIPLLMAMMNVIIIFRFAKFVLRIIGKGEDVTH